MPLQARPAGGGADVRHRQGVAAGLAVALPLYQAVMLPAVVPPPPDDGDGVGKAHRRGVVAVTIQTDVLHPLVAIFVMRTQLVDVVAVRVDKAFQP